MVHFLVFVKSPERNWPDLRRDCDDGCEGALYVSVSSKETDLIYEGIATCICLAWYICINCIKKLTWFTKGLRLVNVFPLLQVEIGKETDLIYEGIATRSWYCIPERLSLKETDLIYEGIATVIPIPTMYSASAKKLTWFTKGLRRNRWAWTPGRLGKKETDLIYEGIATC